MDSKAVSDLKKLVCFLSDCGEFGIAETIYGKFLILPVHPSSSYQEVLKKDLISSMLKEIWTPNLSSES